MTASLLQIQYSCHGCGVGLPPAGRIRVTVRHRRPGQDVVDWMNDCARLVGMDHNRRSPLCASIVCDLLIPVSEDSEGIGFAAKS